jgi:hypothetical protein
MNKIVIIKDYTNGILEFNTISIWIIYKNILGTFGSSTFALNEPLQCAYTHFLNFFSLCVYVLQRCFVALEL